MKYDPMARLVRLSQGRCTNCSGKPLATKSMCARCRELCKKNAKIQRERRKMGRLCIECAVPLSADRKVLRCNDCTQRARDKYRASLLVES